MKRWEEVDNNNSVSKVAFVVEVCCKAKRVVAKKNRVPRMLDAEHDSKRREEVDMK